MVRLISVKCPDCGAALQFEEGRNMAFCSYCGAKILLHNENEYIYRNIDEAEVKQAENDRIYMMKELELEEKQEKHVPVFINNKIQIGSVPHPMTDEHYIEFIESMSDDKKEVKIKFLNPASEPQIDICENADYTTSIEYCNIHGLWIGYRE